jgi:DNA helicase-2/ATP-dependent DNA helicase PcrA
VIAPAGSGKTRVLTERLRHLLADRHVHPSTVTVLAYNNKAVTELQQRCADVPGASKVRIRTLNSLGYWICNTFGAGGQLRVLEEVAVRDLLGRVMEIRRQSNTDTTAPYLAALSTIRLGLVSPAVAEESNPDAAGIAEGFNRYRRGLAELGAVDFDEQIYLALEILLTDPSARTAVQAACRHLLVDEFQDLNPAHLLLLRLISAPTYNCFGVGDDDQVIYGYSGATPEFLIDFPRYFPGAGAHALTVNYRCPPAIVNAARHLLSYNVRRLDKEIHTPTGRNDEVGQAEVDEGAMVEGAVVMKKAPASALSGLAVDTISNWRDQSVALDQIAVLARVNSALLPVQVACVEGGIPCTTPLSANVLSRTGMRTAFAYLRIGIDPGSIAVHDVQETIRRPSRGIAPKVVEMLTSRSRTSIADIRRLAGRLTGRDVPKLEAYADDLEMVAKACGGTTADALRAIRVDIGLGETMDVLDSSRSEADRSTHADDLAALESVAALHPDIHTFESFLRDMLSQRAPDGAAVLLSTVHRIKGREWDRVIIFDASRGLFPHRLGNDEEGERRVFHVALTRARKQVVALADIDAPSIFLDELDGTRVRPPARRASDAAPSSPTSSTATRGSSPPSTRRNRGSSRGNKVFAEVGLPTAEATVGLEVEYRGSTGHVVEVTTEAAVLSLGSVTMKVALGSDVRVGRQTVTLIAPAAPAAAAAAAAETDADTPTVSESALRTWRLATASKDAVPAYVILKNSELADIATRDPHTLAELAACRGMGPIRLDRWGDEILALLDSVRPD